MVRNKVSSILLGFIFLGGCLSGCDKASPVIPAGKAPVLKLIIPPMLLKSKPKSLTASTTVPGTSMGRLKYYITSVGQAPVTGSIDFTSGSDLASVTIPLSKNGKWLVSAEWFYIYDASAGAYNPGSNIHASIVYTEMPEFAGADMAVVEGFTPFSLDMEDIGYDKYSCYSANLTDVTDIDYGLNGGWMDLFNFDSGLSYESITGGAGDIQAAFDLITQSTYFTGPFPVGNSPVSIYQYLGNGDLVDFPSFPPGSPFYADTVQAKSAATGQAGATIIGNDIFVVKVPSTNGVAWVQFQAPTIGSPATNNSALESFRFIYNSQGINYMKFQQTTDGLANCF